MAGVTFATVLFWPSDSQSISATHSVQIIVNYVSINLQILENWPVSPAALPASDREINALLNDNSFKRKLT